MAEGAASAGALVGGFRAVEGSADCAAEGGGAASSFLGAGPVLEDAAILSVFGEPLLAASVSLGSGISAGVFVAGLGSTFGVVMGGGGGGSERRSAAATCASPDGAFCDDAGACGISGAAVDGEATGMGLGRMRPSNGDPLATAGGERRWGGTDALSLGSEDRRPKKPPRAVERTMTPSESRKKGRGASSPVGWGVTAPGVGPVWGLRPLPAPLLLCIG